MNQADPFFHAHGARRWLAALALVAILAAVDARAEVRLPAIFGHNMVLQQGLSIPVWGTAEPGEKVRVAFAGETAAAEADSKGRWKATLPPMKAGAPPGALTVSGKNTVVFTNVDPAVSLFNRAGLPASPFRSDDWPYDRFNPLKTQKKTP